MPRMSAYPHLLAPLDLGFTNALPRTFALWQTENGLNGQNGATDNPDGDRNSNLMEFALGQNGGSSVEDPQFPGFYIERTVAGTLVPWNPNNIDMLATDWFVVTLPN